MKKPIKPNHVWVMEIWSLIHGWTPYGTCQNTRKQGFAALRWCQEEAPNDAFRLRKYVSEAK